MEKKAVFVSDYMEGAHPEILRRLSESNFVKMTGYGLDSCSEAAKEKIRQACRAKEADVFFLVGGTQTNATVIDAMLRNYQGVIAADTGHISAHEAGAIELGGHKVLTLPHHDGKIDAGQIEKLLQAYEGDASREHLVMPGMVYLSHPTEYGTLYSLSELREISAVCRARHIPLFLDGARLSYALACPANDVTLPDLAALCDVFYIGGTKCGALLGEAVVIPRPGLIPHFFTTVKQHGALLAKGWLIGTQFDVLFSENRYETIGRTAIQGADRIRQVLAETGHPPCFGSPTNQVFCLLPDEDVKRLAEKAEFGLWEKVDETHTMVRFVTSWATKAEDVEALCEALKTLS